MYYLFNFEGFSFKNLWGYSSVGRAPALHAGGQEFESLYLHLLRQIIVRNGLAFFFAEMRDSGRKCDIFVHFRPLSGNFAIFTAH